MPPNDKREPSIAPSEEPPKRSSFAVLAFGFAVFGAGLCALVLPVFAPKGSEEISQWIGLPLGAFLGLIAAWLVYALIEPVRALIPPPREDEPVDRNNPSPFASPYKAWTGGGSAPLSPTLEAVVEWVGLQVWVRLPSWWLRALVIVAIGAGLGTAIFLAFENESLTAPAATAAVWVILIAATALSAAVVLVRFTGTVWTLFGKDREPQAPLIDSISADAVSEPQPDRAPRNVGFLKVLLIAVGLWVAYLLVKAAFFSEP